MRTIKVIDPQKFQFYDSPIKRWASAVDKNGNYIACFNSMIVRLKGKC